MDGSAMIEVLLQTPDAALVETHIFAPGETLHAQFLLDLEVANILRKWAARGAIDAVQGSVALADLIHFDLQRHPHDILLPRIWELRNNVTAYDAAYVALAECWVRYCSRGIDALRPRPVTTRGSPSSDTKAR